MIERPIAVIREYSCIGVSIVCEGKRKQERAGLRVECRNSEIS